MGRHTGLFAIAAALLASAACSNGGGGGVADADADGDTDTDADADADGDADTDTGTGTDADTDGDADADTDADGDADMDSGVGVSCTDGDSDGWCLPFDCDDASGAVYPSAVDWETDGVDNDCDGVTDEGIPDASVTCDEQDFTIARTPVAMMILLDKSGSMANSSKWTQAVAAITDIVNDWDTQVQFGFDVFPDGSSCDGYSNWCGVYNPVVRNCAPGNASNIISDMGGMDPDGDATPLYCGMKNFMSISTYAGNCVGTDTATYLIVVSDGADNCTQTCTTADCESGSSVTTGAFETLSGNLYASGITTIAIGFGSGAPVSQLEAIAEFGGLGVADGYFSATDGTALEAALTEIVTGAISCTYAVDDPSASANPDEVNFYFDGTVVPNIDIADCDTENGWAWTDSTHDFVEFCGTYCDDIKFGTVTEISAAFGCPTIVG